MIENKINHDVKFEAVHPMFSPSALAEYFNVDVSAITKARRRGRIPPPDLRFGNRPRWSWETVQAIRDRGKI